MNKRKTEMFSSFLLKKVESEHQPCFTIRWMSEKQHKQTINQQTNQN